MNKLYFLLFPIFIFLIFPSCSSGIYDVEIKSAKYEKYRDKYYISFDFDSSGSSTGYTDTDMKILFRVENNEILNASGLYSIELKYPLDAVKDKGKKVYFDIAKVIKSKHSDSVGFTGPDYWHISTSNIEITF
jgi:hypothetical protein